jgi:hypothetical protein
MTLCSHYMLEEESARYATAEATKDIVISFVPKGFNNDTIYSHTRPCPVWEFF